MHNSNSKTLQKALLDEELEEDKWGCLGFVSIEFLGVEPFVWRLSLVGESLEKVYMALSEQENRHYD